MLCIILKVMVGSDTLWKSYSNNQYQTTTGSGMGHCKNGEKIWIEAESSGNIYGSEDTMLYIHLIRYDDQ